MRDVLDSVVQTPLFGVAVTVLAYVAALGLQRKNNRLHPLFVASGLLIVLLLVARIDYADYRIGGDLIIFMLGPATVALGVPLYKHAQRIRRNLVPILTGIVAGSAASIVSAWILVTVFGGSQLLLLSMLPKSTTAPVSTEIVRMLGGHPELAAVLTVLTGLFGSMFGPALLRKLRIRSDMAVGTAIGTSAHGIGTARVIRESELQGGISGFSMGVAAIVTSLLVVPLYWWFG